MKEKLNIKIDPVNTIPIYQQIADGIVSAIKKHILIIGDKLPSINQLSKENGLAKETIVKAFKLLKEKGIIDSVHGKGFFVKSTNICIQKKVFVLFDTLSAYKQILLKSMEEEFGKHVSIDLFFHHYNFSLFKSIIDQSIGNYSNYIISPFENPKMDKVLISIPEEQLFIIDRKPKNREKYCGVYQDFESDIFEALVTALPNIKKYTQTTLVFRNTITVLPNSLIEGFEKFCLDYNITGLTLKTNIGNYIQKGEAYIVIDDEDLVFMVKRAKELNLKLGEDVGIISYNETSLKSVVADGISVISTDFEKMGKDMAKMINNEQRAMLKNPWSFIDRKSF